MAVSPPKEMHCLSNWKMRGGENEASFQRRATRAVGHEWLSAQAVFCVSLRMLPDSWLWLLRSGC